MIIVLYQLYEFNRNSLPLYAESLEGLFYFLFNYIDFSQHNNKLNSNCVYSLHPYCYHCSGSFHKYYKKFVTNIANITETVSGNAV